MRRAACRRPLPPGGASDPLQHRAGWPRPFHEAGLRKPPYSVGDGLRGERSELDQVLQREVPEGVVAIQALPEKEAPGREAVVGPALGILERGYGLARGRGAVVRLHAGLLARPVAQPQELEHPVARVPVLSDGLEQVGAPQRQKLARLEGTHRGVARGIGQEGCLPEERSGLKRRQVPLLSPFFLHHDLHPTTPQQVALLAILALPDDGGACGDRFRFETSSQLAQARPV